MKYGPRHVLGVEAELFKLLEPYGKDISNDDQFANWTKQSREGHC
jgi:hypothetical protein